MASSMRMRERRKFAIEHLGKYVKGLEENPSFREVLALQSESSCLDANELTELIQKFGTGTFVDSEGHGVDIIRHVLTSTLQHCPPSPSDDEISWILSAGSRLRANRMVASVTKFSLVSGLFTVDGLLV